MTTASRSNDSAASASPDHDTSHATGPTDSAASAASASTAAPTGPTTSTGSTNGGLRRLLLGATAVAVVVWLAVLVAWQDAPFALTFDDAYYYFAIARNIAAGHGSTFDQINSTNGYHPLWMAVSIVPFKLGFDDLAAARVLLAFQVVVGWGGALSATAILVSRAVDGWRRGLAPPESRDGAGNPGSPLLERRANLTITLIFLAVALNPFLVKVFVNGLESGIAVVLYALVLLAAARRYQWTPPSAGRRRAATARADADRNTIDGWVVGSTRSWRLRMALLLALVFLARTDAVILIGCLGLWCAAEAWRARRRAHLSTGAALVALVELFGLPAVTLAVYLVTNNAFFGAAVQVSGLVKRATPDAAGLGLLLVLVALAALVGVRSFQRTHGRAATRPARFPHAGDLVRRTGWFAAFAILIVGYYNVAQTQQWLWYYCPVVFYLVVLFLLAVADMIEVALVSPAPASPGRALVIVGAIFLVPLTAGLVFQIQSFTDPTILSIHQANRDAGEWIAAEVPTDAVMASWDAGVVGYFSHRRVINIDGVVNSKEFYDAMRTGQVPSFLRCRHLGYVVNHGAQTNGRDRDIDGFIRALHGPDAESKAVVIHAVPFQYSGTANTGGFELAGERQLAVDVYEIPAGVRGPTPADSCPR